MCTKLQNNQNIKSRKDNTSGFKGVFFKKDKNLSKPWMALIGVKRKNIFLGVFRTREEAAQVYNQAAIKYFGEFACLNKICKRRSSYGDDRG
jgi:hypothetical protein